ncbi:hypothetical protein J0A68_15120 [Algoriphagus sp. H41]|uniref:Uncharacterized protein n=1 Tax=Algoriphagus oliviformis TaxID=2811231 RepID=A0ABS3C5K5_9BACT|nr:hypothetical protein [Algoriphagus oliviformis]MBN7812283.1 hypothetical protein [Algoriphagus oliviformis]
MEAVSFERVMNFNFGRADVGRMDVIDDRLYYSNIVTPGYFDKTGTQVQYGTKHYDMRFGHIFTKDFMVGVSENRRSLIFLPNIGFASNKIIYLNALNIPDLQGDLLLMRGWSEVPNFSLNGNYLLSSWELPLDASREDAGKGVFLLELNMSGTEGGLVLDRDQPVLRRIPLGFAIEKEMKPIYQIITAFPFEQGWLASINVDGVQTSVKIEKDGRIDLLQNRLERFVLYSVERSSQGELFVSDEDGLLYSESGNPFELVRIATVNRFLRFKFLEDRVVVWTAEDRIFELKDFRDVSKIRLVELENKGLEGIQVKDVELFNGSVYVSTNGGFFVKEEADFWAEKVESIDPSMGIGWELSF